MSGVADKSETKGNGDQSPEAGKSIAGQARQSTVDLEALKTEMAILCEPITNITAAPEFNREALSVAVVAYNEAEKKYADSNEGIRANGEPYAALKTKTAQKKVAKAALKAALKAKRADKRANVPKKKDASAPTAVPDRAPGRRNNFRSTTIPYRAPGRRNNFRSTSSRGQGVMSDELEQNMRRLESKLLALGIKAREERNSWDRSQDVMANPKLTWTPHLGALLAGVDDDASVLAILKGKESSLLHHIYGYAFKFVFENWRSMIAPGYKQYVHNTIPANMINHSKLISRSMANRLKATCDDRLTMGNYGEHSPGIYARCTSGASCAFTRCGMVAFPPPSDIDINMMPFVMGDRDSLPDFLQPYYDALVAQCPVSSNELGKVCYLSVTERYIEKGNTQRRGGLHIEAPIHYSGFLPGNSLRARWGNGFMGRDSFTGGIFMASNISSSCAIWDALINQDTTDSHGGMEHLRPLLNAPYFIPANELIWMTDRTPHQAMPQPQSGYRQFFRLVTSDFNVWHSKHCTANPKVPLPPHVRVIYESRFQDEGEDEDRKPAARP